MSEFKKVYLCKGEEIINTLRLRNRSDFILAEKNNFLPLPPIQAFPLPKQNKRCHSLWTLQPFQEMDDSLFGQEKKEKKKKNLALFFSYLTSLKGSFRSC